MGSLRSGMTRGAFARGMFVLPALAGCAVATALAGDQKASQSAMQYQTHPNGDQQCLKCTFFQPADAADAPGTCKIVDGAISPNGYCVAFSPKS